MLRLDKNNAEKTPSFTAPRTDLDSPAETAAAPATSVEARRVRPEELAAALSAIEARRNSTLSETVPLGVALRELQTDMTSEEVWREIDALRARQTSEAQRQQEVKSRRRRQVGGWALGTGALIAIAIATRVLMAEASGSQTTPPLHARPVATTTAPPVLYRTEPFFRMTPTTVTLSKLPEGVSVPMEFNQIMELKRALYGRVGLSPNSPLQQSRLTGPIPREITDNFLVDPKADPGDRAPWYFTKLNGKYYLRCWTMRKLPLDLIQTQRVDFYNIPPGDPALGNDKVMQQVQIPLDSMGEGYSMTGGRLESKAQFSVLNLDSNAWDKWPYTPPPGAHDPGTMTFVSNSGSSNGFFYQSGGMPGGVVIRSGAVPHSSSAPRINPLYHR